MTLDKDFGALAILAAQPQAGIVRLVDIAARQRAHVCVRALARFGVELAAAAIVTAEPGRLRPRTNVSESR